jgi:hypothetical protein
MKKIVFNTDYETFGFSIMFWEVQYFKQKKYVLRLHFISWSLSIRF